LSEVKTSPAEQPFTLSGNAVICDNTSGENGGGVYLQGTDFIMDENSSITRNEAKTGSGGAVIIAGNMVINGSAYPGGHFTLRGGSISDNTAGLYGGGVIVRRNESSGRSALFKMEGGLISGNSAGKGGGIAVQHGTEFEKDTAGYIYGSEASPDVRNTASTGSAVWVAANDADDDLVGLEKSVEASRGLSKPYGNWTDP
jgi:predicted outer membrane repeat protein